MKSLVVFYSRSGNTRALGEEIATLLSADLEEIRDTKNRSGIWGWILSGRDGMRGNLTIIEPPQKDPTGYDLVIIGTPTWAGRMSSATRTYLTQNKGRFGKVAFFSTGGDSKGSPRMFPDMEAMAGKKPLATLAVSSGEVKSGAYKEKARAFMAELLG